MGSIGAVRPFRLFPCAKRNGYENSIRVSVHRTFEVAANAHRGLRPLPLIRFRGGM